jgi:hypothetical protein
MTSLHIGVSDLVEGGLAKLTANLVAVLAYVIAVVLLDWALLWTEASTEVRYELAVIVYGVAALVIWSLLRLALGGKLTSLDRDPEEFTLNEPLDGKAATTHAKLAGGNENHSLLDIRIDTGRKHQIRVQLAHAGLPIVGDRKYGSRQPFPGGIALHARRLVIEHPVSKMQVELTAVLPASWRGYVDGS